MEYARLLKSKISFWGNLLVIMRAYLYVWLKFTLLFPCRTDMLHGSEVILFCSRLFTFDFFCTIVET
jgi:hypothetical protein